MTEMALLTVEVAGCPTVCRHCWAQGTPYAPMPVDDIARVLDDAAPAFASAGIPLLPFPMHEAVAHPEATTVLPMFQEAAAAEFHPLYEPLSTTGVPLATRSDWREVLECCRALGTTMVWPALHGAGETHDAIVHREGAYRETLLGIERARAVGFEAGCNVFVTRENAGQFDAMADDLVSRGVGQISVEPAAYLPTGRGRRYHRVRPELEDLLPLADRVLALTIFHRDRWENLEAYTEGTWTRGALAGAWSAEPRNTGAMLELVCRRNLDVYSGSAGLYRRRHGNLRADGAEAVWRDARENGVRSSDELWFGTQPIPPVDELADRFGDPEGRAVHFTSESVRYRWLDLARPSERGALARAS